MLDERPTPCKRYVSLSRSSKVSGAFHTHFTHVEIKSLTQLADLMNHRIWSPIVWKDGVRLRSNYLECSFIALDFDDGRLSLDEAIGQLDTSGLAYIIGTSKSHQKEKKSPGGKTWAACDRFRIVFSCSAPQTIREEYEFNMKSAMDVWPCDPSCKDAARFFYGCPTITKVKEGEDFDWLKIPEEMKQENVKRRSEELLNQHKIKGTMPSWAERVLKNGAPPGERHYFCYRLGATLSQLGYTEKQIIGFCMKSPLKDIGVNDVERAVINGWERAGRDISERSHGCDRSAESREQY